jgi:hypothetical protein
MTQETVGSTPAPSEPQIEDADLTFIEAFEELLHGKVISKREWEDKDTYCYRKNGYATIHTKGKDHQWLISDGDMNGIDWFLTGDTVELD